MSDYYLSHSAEGYSIYLAHHGILGMKQGVRRYQNKDGSLTSSGKIRYGSNKSNSSTNKLLKTKLEDIDHDSSGSVKREVAKLALNVAIDALRLNPIGMGMDIYRIGTAVSAGVKEKSAAKRIAKAPIDEKTGLPLKTKNMSADMDVKLVNPGFRNFNSNTKNNCVLCSTAFELRRRGFDITASKAAVGYTSDEYLKWFKGAKEETKGGFNYLSYRNRSLKTGKELYDWAEPKLLSQGDGARGYLSVLWGAGGGHSMAYEVNNGKVVVYDAQSGKKKSLRSITNASVDIGFTRLDDKEPNWAAMKKAGVI